jgi:hypothetical protein
MNAVLLLYMFASLSMDKRSNQLHDSLEILDRICVAVALLRFLTGMTTICAMEGMSDDEIKLLGHWKINVYYI